MKLPLPASTAVAVVALALVFGGCGTVPASTGLTPTTGSHSTTAPTPRRTAEADTTTPTSTSGSTSPGRPTPTMGKGTAAAVLDTLTVKGRAAMTGYSRDQFGLAWADVDRNGCDTRNDILARDLTGEKFRPGTHNCVVTSGHFVEPYSGASVKFLRGVTTSAFVQIDHVVALADAWQSGAQQWTPATRLAYANDPLVLLAADGSLNQQKSASDAASWLPPNKSYRCVYVARQVSVKAKYGLWVKPAEKAAMTRVLTACPNQPTLTSRQATTEPASPGSAAKSSSKPP